ncbi:hypothetical protein GCM10010421_23540 [Streptomyces glaucus]|uniref:Secreted protein n=1 Tax=Streptomyces glaucus TaxID=284029 RepID=A0ABP5WUL2_9ACTN
MQLGGCEGLPPVRTEVSCGLTSFGDLRHHCPRGRDETRSVAACVTARDTGDAPARVAVISGTGPGGNATSGRRG